jgi:nicotinate-nucleotide pyrophosphorylase (carboxylating)
MCKNSFEFEKIDALLHLAIQEDIGSGDITTESLIPEKLIAEGVFVAKEDGIVAGLPVVEYFFSTLDKGVVLKRGAGEGAFVARGDTIAVISGRVRTLLSGERIALNILQRMSGIATFTKRFVDRIRPSRTPIMDTRKTIPGWRYLEKYSVAIGGGVNHRMGLYDQALIKDNHLDILKNCSFPEDSQETSTIEKAVSVLRKKVKKNILIEVEARSLAEVMDAIKSGAEIILLDNMSILQLQESVKLVNDWHYTKGLCRPLTEASGNITLENVHQVAQTGVDRISVGAITHSAKAMDISLEINSI